MEKAYDLKVLGERLQAQGLPIANDMLEEVAAKVYVEIKNWAKESAPLSKTTIDDFIAPFYDQLDKVVFPLIDNFDGEDDGIGEN